MMPDNCPFREPIKARDEPDENRYSDFSETFRVSGRARTRRSRIAFTFPLPLAGRIVNLQPFAYDGLRCNPPESRAIP